ncbi:hypothetical protein V6N12_055788 [Hibiscus sabdariffa]|uniref:Uncharacterized protein n=1 Tax=Hibiscus sabdariffa TaxID=183260 RepID=A0ABR2AIY1_9ROSI
MKGRSKGEDPTLRSAALDHIVMDQTQGQECLMVLVETMTFEEVNSNGVLFQQIFLKDTNERKVAYIAGPAYNWWGFTIDEFVKFYVFKFRMSTFVFQKALWGPCYFNLETRMTVGKKESAGGRKAQAMFVQFVLEPLWQTYHAALELKVSKGILEEVIKDLQILLQAVKILVAIHVEVANPKDMHSLLTLYLVSVAKGIANYTLIANDVLPK